MLGTRTRLLAISVALATTVVGLPAVAQAAPPTPPIAAFSVAAPVDEAPSGLVARAVIPDGASCPQLRVEMDDRTARWVRMAQRPRPQGTSPAFNPITVCSTSIPVGAHSADVSGLSIPAHLPRRVERLGMLGDSGCRMKGNVFQDCSTVDNWPLARIASSLASDRPDAILFNGDFFYREATCPDDLQLQCGSSPAPIGGLPFKDSAYGWIADALLPMQPMFASAPLIVSRGNHEECYRGGNGYFYIFDPRQDTWNDCAPFQTAKGLAVITKPTKTYTVDLPVRPGRTLRLAMVDTAGGLDSEVSKYSMVQRPAYVRAAALTKRQPGRESWLLGHRPVYGFQSTEVLPPGSGFTQWMTYDQGAAAWGLLDNYDLLFSSHIHVAEAVQLPGLPGLLVLGNAGTMLEPTTGYPLPTDPFTVGEGKTYPAPKSAWVSVKFGYGIATPNAEHGSWTIRMLDEHGDQFARCGVKSRQIYCADSAG